MPTLSMIIILTKTHNMKVNLIIKKSTKDLRWDGGWEKCERKSDNRGKQRVNRVRVSWMGQIVFFFKSFGYFCNFHYRKILFFLGWSMAHLGHMVLRHWKQG